MSREGGWYDEADDYYDDEADDDDWDDGFGDGAYGTVGSLAAKAKKKPAGGGGTQPVAGPGGGKQVGAVAGKPAKAHVKPTAAKPGPPTSPPPASAMARTMRATNGEKGVAPLISENTMFPPAPSAGGVTSTPFDFAGPSPDDTVLAKRAGSGNPGLNGGEGGGGVGLDEEDDESARLAKLSLRERETETPTEKPKVADYSSYQPSPDELVSYSTAGKPKLHLVVIGHVDAGKSTLMGRVLHLVGTVSDKQVHRNTRDAAAAGKASFNWAWALDERPEERARGVTVDVARVQFDTGKTYVTLLDAPGHKDFVPNAIIGMSQADVACLVLDASGTNFESGFGVDASSSSSDASYYDSSPKTRAGQTREHVRLARSLGVDFLVVAVSKMDSVGYDENRFRAIKAAIEPFLKTSGFGENKTVFVPVSGVEGVNLVDTVGVSTGVDAVGVPASLSAWYRGPSLLGAIDNLPPINRGSPKPLRLPVSEIVVGDRELGTCAIGGKIESGSIRVGEKVVVMPCGQTAVVKHVRVLSRKSESTNGDKNNVAFVGDAVDIGLEKIDFASLEPGSVLCHSSWPVVPTNKFVVKVVTLDTLRVPLLTGSNVVCHHYATAVDAKVRGFPNHHVPPS